MQGSQQALESGAARLRDIAKDLLTERRLILVSNRGPLEYRVQDDGSLQGRRGAGGVVTALTAVSYHVDVTWIAGAMGEGDRRAAQQAGDQLLTSPYAGQRLNVRFVITPRSVYHKYYNVFCNPLLWFLQHYMWNSPYTPNVSASTHDAWQNGYVPVNRAFAEQVIREAKDDVVAPFVMLHDYHLYLVGGYIREALPNVILQHFTHIPWPTPSYWQLLPAEMRGAICESLCACDIVGFQAIRDVRNFLQTCEAFLEDAEVDYRRGTVWYKGHLTTVNVYPISVDVANLHRLSRSARVRIIEEKLKPFCGEKTIVRVDRAEPSKNIVRGFRAFDTLLERYPEHRGKVKFLSFLVPSRTHIRQYQRYMDEIKSQVAQLNEKYRFDDWEPISLFIENNYPQGIAAMRLYDVLLVNAVIDGMNLVAKEGPVVNTKDGVLILSETVGAYQQLKDNVLPVAPADLEGTVNALHAALTMDAEERQRRAQKLRNAVEGEDILRWLSHQFEDLRMLA
jgi:trehalose 6-phosphate synthase